MPFSDQFGLRVGDRVRDRHSGEQGRVTDIVTTAQGITLVTVAIFVGAAITNKRQYQIPAGSRGDLQRLGGDLLDTNKGASVTDPAKGTVSEKAKQQASRNLDPHEPSFRTGGRRHSPSFKEHYKLAVSREQHLDANILDALQDKGPLTISYRRGIEQKLVEGIRQHDESLAQLRQFNLDRWKKEFKGQKPLHLSDKEWLAYQRPSTVEPSKLNLAARSRLQIGAGDVPLLLQYQALQGRPDSLGASYTRSIFEDPRGFYERATAGRTRIHDALRGFYQERAQLDQTVEYLLRRSSQTPQGTWTGGFLNDLFFQEGKAPVRKLAEKVSEVQRLFGEIGETELLERTIQAMQALPRHQRARAWKEIYGPRLAETIKRSQPYSRLNERIQTFQRRSETYGRALEVLNEFELEPLTEALDSLDYNSGYRYGPQFNPAVHRISLFTPDQYVGFEDDTYTRKKVGRAKWGRQMGFNLEPGRLRKAAPGIHQLTETGEIVGKVVDFQGSLFRVAGVPKNRGVSLTALGESAEFFTDFPFDWDFAAGLAQSRPLADNLAPEVLETARIRFQSLLPWSKLQELAGNRLERGDLLGIAVERFLEEAADLGLTRSLDSRAVDQLVQKVQETIVGDVRDHLRRHETLASEMVRVTEEGQEYNPLENVAARKGGIQPSELEWANQKLLAAGSPAEREELFQRMLATRKESLQTQISNLERRIEALGDWSPNQPLSSLEQFFPGQNYRTWTPAQIQQQLAARLDNLDRELTGLQDELARVGNKSIVELALEGGIDLERALYGSDILPGPRPKSALNQEAFAILDEFLEGMNAGRLRVTPEVAEHLVLLPTGKFGVRVFATGGDPFVYTGAPLVNGEASSLPRTLHSLKQPGRILYSGDVSELAKETLRTQDFVRSARVLEQSPFQRTLAQQVNHEAVTEAAQSALQEGQRLALYTPNTGRAVGFVERGGIEFAQVNQNIQELFGNRNPFLILDIENDVQTGEITNVFAEEYSWKNGKLVRGESIHRATRAEVNGKKVGINLVSEERLVQDVSQWLNARQDRLVAGHNIGHDAGALLKKSPDLEWLTGKLVDTQVTAQLAGTSSTQFDLNSLVRQTKGLIDDQGQLRKQPHLAKPDVRMNAELIEAQAAQYGDQILQRSATLKNVSPNPGDLLWDVVGNGERGSAGRAYRYLGTLDSKALEEELRQRGITQGPTVGWMAEEIDFVTGKGTGRQVPMLSYSPSQMAGEFQHRFQSITEAEFAQKAAARTRDAAGRTVRRMVTSASDTPLLEQVLKTRLRAQMAAAAGATGDLNRAHKEALGRHLAAQSDFEQSLTRSLPGYIDNYLSDHRTLAEYQSIHQFWGREMRAHEPVLDYLQDFVAQAGPAERRQALAQASEIWENYFRQVNEILPWATQTGVQVPDDALRLTFKVPGKDRPVHRAIRIANEGVAAADLERLMEQTMIGVAGREPERLLPAGASAGHHARLRQILGQVEENKDLRVLLHDPELGPGIRQTVWERYLQPSLAEGSTGATPFRLTAQDPGGAVQELVAQGQAHAQRQMDVTDYLAPRDWGSVEEPLQKMQERLLRRSPGEVFDQMLRTMDPVFQQHHGVPVEHVGQSMAEAMRAAKGTQGQEAMINTLRRIGETLTSEEAQGLRLQLGKIDPVLNEYVFYGNNEYRTFKPTARVPTVSPPSARKFRPGGLHQFAQETFENISENRQFLKGAGLLALGVGSAWALDKILQAPQAPPPIHTPQEEGRKREEPQPIGQQGTQRVRVRIEGEASASVNYEELTSSIHQVLQAHYGTRATPSVQLQDRRQNIDRAYMQGLVGDLLRD